MMHAGGRRPFKLVLMTIARSTGTVLETWVWKSLRRHCAPGVKRVTRSNILRCETAC